MDVATTGIPLFFYKTNIRSRMVKKLSKLRYCSGCVGPGSAVQAAWLWPLCGLSETFLANKSLYGIWVSTVLSEFCRLRGTYLSEQWTCLNAYLTFFLRIYLSHLRWVWWDLLVPGQFFRLDGTYLFSFLDWMRPTLASFIGFMEPYLASFIGWMGPTWSAL